MRDLKVVLKAYVPYTAERFFSRSLNNVVIEWTKDSYPPDAPMAVQEVGVADVATDNVRPEVYGMLRLMEQSLEVVDLARQGTIAVV